MGNWIETASAGSQTAAPQPDAPNVSATCAVAYVVADGYTESSEAELYVLRGVVTLPTTDEHYDRLRKIVVWATGPDSVAVAVATLQAPWSGSTVSWRSELQERPESGFAWAPVKFTAYNDDDHATASPYTISSVSVTGLVRVPLLPTAVAGEEHADERVVDPDTRLVGTPVYGSVTLPANHRAQWAEVWITSYDGAGWDWVGKWPVSAGAGAKAFGPIWRVAPQEGAEWKLKALTGRAAATNAVGDAVESAAFSVGGLGLPPATAVTDFAIAAGTGPEGNPYNQYRADGSVYALIPEVTYTDPTGLNDFYVRITVQEYLGSTPAGPERPFWGAQVADGSQKSPTLACEYTWEADRIRYRGYVCNRKNQTTESYLDAGCAALQTSGWAAAGYKDVVIGTAPGRKEAGGNLCPDPRFDDADAAWELIGNGCYWDDSLPHSTPKCLALGPREGHPFASGCFGTTRSLIPVTAARNYAFSLWIRCAWADGPIAIWVSWFNAAKEYFDRTQEVLNPADYPDTAAWYELKPRIWTAPAGAVYAQVVPLIYLSGNGVLSSGWWLADDVRFMEATDLQTVAPESFGTSLEVRDGVLYLNLSDTSNLVRNPGFEERPDLTGWESAGATLDYVGAQSAGHVGERLKLEPGGWARESDWHYTHSGREYLVSVAISSDPGAAGIAKVQAMLLDGAGEQPATIDVVTKAAGVVGTVTAKLTIPTGTARFRLLLTNTEAATYCWYFDSVLVRPVTLTGPGAQTDADGYLVPKVSATISVGADGNLTVSGLPRVAGLPTLPNTYYPAGAAIINTLDSKVYRTADGNTWLKSTDPQDLVSGAIASGVTLAAAQVNAGTFNGFTFTGCTLSLNYNGVTTTINNAADGSSYSGLKTVNNSTGEVTSIRPTGLRWAPGSPYSGTDCVELSGYYDSTAVHYYGRLLLKSTGSGPYVTIQANQGQVLTVDGSKYAQLEAYNGSANGYDGAHSWQITGQGLSIGGLQVVGARKAAIGWSTGLGDVVTKVNQILAVLGVTFGGHGLTGD